MARDISQLHPRLQYKIKKLQKECKKKGLKLDIGECFRTAAEQDALYAKGRTAPGSVVTNARGSSYSSQHQWGVAFDIFQNVKGHEYDSGFFDKVAKIAKSKKVGLKWGGDWRSIVDKPHFYLGTWGSTPTKLKSKYGSFTKFKATWTGTVKKNCKLWGSKSLDDGKMKCKIPKGSKVDILFKSKLGYAKVKYDGKYGYVFRSVLK